MSVKRLYPDTPLVAVGALVYRDNKILLVKRGQQPNKEKWSIPGGLVETGETLTEAVHREIFKECNIKIELKQKLDIFEYIQKNPRGKVQYHYVIIDFIAEYLSGELKPQSDILAASWVTKKECKSMNITEGLLTLVNKAKEYF